MLKSIYKAKIGVSAAEYGRAAPPERDCRRTIGADPEPERDLTVLQSYIYEAFTGRRGKL